MVEFHNFAVYIATTQPTTQNSSKQVCWCGIIIGKKTTTPPPYHHHIGDDYKSTQSILSVLYYIKLLENKCMDFTFGKYTDGGFSDN